MTWVLQWLLQGVAVAAVASASVHLVPVTVPRLRHLLWWLALASVLALPWIPALTVSHASAALDAAPSALAVQVAPPPAWFSAAFLTLWAGSSLFGLLSLAVDLRVLRALKRGSRLLPWPESRVAGELQAAASASRGARFAVSDELGGACAVGFFAPRVIVSSQLVASIEPAALESIVRHELAHLERFDDWLRLGQRLVLAVTGLHPAVRWISRHIDIEREAACDRMVVERTGSPLTYARALTAVAEATAGVRLGEPALAPGASAAGAGLHARVVRLLRNQVQCPRRIRATAVASIATLALAVAGVAGLPPLVSIASLEPSLRAIASLPAGRAFVPQLPPVQPRPLPKPVDAGEPASSARPEPTASVETPHASTSTEVVVPEPAAPPPAVPAERLDVPARREVRVELTAPDGSPSRVTGVVGARAARVGSTAARTGSAIGHFFSKGGQAVADRF